MKIKNGEVSPMTKTNKMRNKKLKKGDLKESKKKSIDVKMPIEEQESEEVDVSVVDESDLDMDQIYDENSNEDDGSDDEQNNLKNNSKLDRNEKEIKVKKAKEAFNASTSFFLSCRSFKNMSPDQLKIFLSEQSIEVVNLYKHPPKNRFAFVDVGSEDKVVKCIKKLNGVQCKGSVLVAEKIISKEVIEKSNKAMESKQARELKRIQIIDCLLCVKNLSKFVSRKTLTDVFKNAKSIVIPPQKGNAFREALLVFETVGQANEALKEFQGCELAGSKLVVQRLQLQPLTAAEEKRFKGRTGGGGGGGVDDDVEKMVEGQIKKIRAGIGEKTTNKVEEAKRLNKNSPSKIKASPSLNLESGEGKKLLKKSEEKIKMEMNNYE